MDKQKAFKARRSLRLAIIRHLKNVGSYEKTDNTLIDELVFNVKMSEDAKFAIYGDDDNNNKGSGLLQNVRKSDEDPYYQPHPNMTIYNTAIKSIQSIYTKLGIAPQERAKLKLVAVKKKGDDPLSEFL